MLIEERDEILEKLETAEAKYISSFKLTTPEPSVMDFMPSGPMLSDMPPPAPPKPEISRPRPLGAGVCVSITRTRYNAKVSFRAIKEDAEGAIQHMGLRRSPLPVRSSCLRSTTRSEV